MRILYGYSNCTDETYEAESGKQVMIYAGNIQGKYGIQKNQKREKQRQKEKIITQASSRAFSGARLFL